MTTITSYGEGRKGPVGEHDDDRELVAEVLEQVGDYSNLAAGRLVGVSEGTFRRWRAGDIAVPLRTDTRLALRRYLTNAEEVEKTSAADQLIAVFDHPEYVRRVAGRLTVQDRISAAYAIALADRLPPEEMKKLDEWRDSLLESGEAHGS